MEILEFEDDNAIRIDNLEDNLPHLPPRVPKRGRPKGKDKTVIGVPKKRKLTSKLLPFEELPVDIRHYEMLRWFVDDGIAKSAVYENKSVHEEYVEIVPERVSNVIMDKAIAIDEIKCYLTEESWLVIQQVIKMKKLTPTWICPICAKDAATKSICCNRCLEWSHFICVRVNANFKSKLWFCNFCKVSNTNLKNTT
ncbi:uncharacterized protein LOC115034281 [Acyrthosiphon pisum]|uniref:Zinc finger PHD-type domain-containing protein n=1 Tax=Acyrthosiphon pisum TaxID=7029 RepID=A0A8R2NUV5_ACYPI|nr:uncharacterized protein LOC115034281 [Acyrthosiphon pisum]